MADPESVPNVGCLVLARGWRQAMGPVVTVTGLRSPSLARGSARATFCLLILVFTRNFSHGNKFCSSPPRWQKQRYYESTTEYSQEPRCACSLLELYCSVNNREKATKKEAEEKRRKREKEKSWSQTPSDERGEDCQSQSKSYQLELP